MVVKHKQVSLSGQIFEQLEKDILTGKLKRGEVFTETEIASMLGVSRTPVREAISRLEQENMIEETTKGIRIIGISTDDALCIYDIREKLEGMVARKAALNISDEELKEMKDSIEYHEFVVSKEDPQKAHECDDSFHEILYRASGSEVLYNTLIPLHKKIQKFRRLTVSDAGRAAQSQKEHVIIYEALKEHDPDKAEKAVTEHIANAKANAEKRFAEVE